MSTTNETSTQEAPAQAAPAKTAVRKERVGQVVSTKMQKTLVVESITRVPHPLFGKIVKHRKRFYVHDEEGKAQLGDTVRIGETRPLSKLKRWELLEVIKH